MRLVMPDEWMSSRRAERGLRGNVLPSALPVRRGIWGCLLAVCVGFLGCAEAPGPEIAGRQGGTVISPVLPNHTGKMPVPPGRSSGPASTPLAEALRQEAFDAAERLVKEFPDDPSAVYMLGSVYDRYGNGPEAERCWKQCLDLDSRYVLACYCLGETALERADYRQAERWLRAALNIDPAMSEAHLALGKAMIGLGRMEEAIAPLERHIRLSGRSPEGYFSLGQVYLHLGEYEKARQCHQAALDIDPNWWNAYGVYYGLATALRRLGREQEAQEYLAKFSKLKAENEQAIRDRYQSYDDPASLRSSAAHLLVGMAQVYAEHGHLQKAAQLRQRVAQLAPKGKPSHQRPMPTNER